MYGGRTTTCVGAIGGMCALPVTGFDALWWIISAFVLVIVGFTLFQMARTRPAMMTGTVRGRRKSNWFTRGN